MRLSGLWAKTNRRAVEAAARAGGALKLRRHLWLHHARDTAGVLQALLTVPRLADWLEALAGTALGPADRERLAVLAFLHDLGKLDPDFQFLGEPGRALPPVLPRHDLIAARLIPELGRPGGATLPAAGLLRTVAAWFPAAGTARPLRRGTVGARAPGLDLLDVIAWHHGRVLPPDAVLLTRQHRFLARNWLAEPPPVAPLAAELEEVTPALFPLAFGDAAPLPVPHAFLHAVLGLVILADWLASTHDPALPGCAGFPWSDEPGAAREATTAAAMLAAVGLAAPARPRLPATLAELIDQAAPTPLQQEALAVPLAPGALLCAEEATGGGKTEMAFAVFARCLALGLCDGLFFALPTRVAAREIFARIRRLAMAKLAIPAHQIVLAVPGYLEEPALPGDVGETEREPLGWAQRQSRVFATARIAVGTVDQALRTVVRMPHAQLGWAGLARLLLVVDEVHASDAYMGVLLQRLVARHRRTGGITLLLSATLGLDARAALFGLESGAALAERAYPALTVAPSAGAAPALRPIAPTPAAKPPVRMVREEAGPDRALLLARLAAGYAARGCRVLVIANRVQSALDTFLALEGPAAGGFDLLTVAGVPTPHHGRYARTDREIMDEAVTAAFGRVTTRTRLVLVATQTAEQSLDIDADVLLTDLAPIDVLLQRIGRLWRHRRDERPLDGPVCHVLCPPDYAPLLAGRPVHGIGAPYRDARMLRAADGLLARGTWNLPAMSRELVEAGVSEAALGKLAEQLDGGGQGAWWEHAQRTEGSAIMERDAARQVLLDIDQPVRTQPVDERAATRLGGHDLLVRLPGVTSPFGRRVDQLAIRHRLLGGAQVTGDAEAQAVEAVPGGFRFEVAGRRFLYDRLGLRPEGEAA